jgi:acyl carrier protein
MAGTWIALRSVVESSKFYTLGATPGPGAGPSHGAKSSHAQRDRDLAIDEQIKAILKEHARLAVDVNSLDDESDLYQAGMTSHASVNLMLALEDRFEIEFPERMLRRRAFGNISAIRAAIEELTSGRA